MNAPSHPCIFCEIIAGSAESSEIYRGDSCIAFLDLSPINPGHALVCPTRHISSFLDVEPGELSEMLSVAQRVSRSQLAKLPGCSGVNLLLSEGESAGQEVPHVHLHVVPRAEGDEFGWRRFGSSSSREELDAIAAQLHCS